MSGPEMIDVQPQSLSEFGPGFRFFSPSQIRESQQIMVLSPAVFGRLLSPNLEKIHIRGILKSLPGGSHQIVEHQSGLIRTFQSHIGHPLIVAQLRSLCRLGDRFFKILPCFCFIPQCLISRAHKIESLRVLSPSDRSPLAFRTIFAFFRLDVVLTPI